MSTATNLIKSSLDSSAFCINAYLSDLSDADLMVRPVPGINHIAWQLGHLIKSEHELINQVCPGAMPALPEGFAARYSKETAGSDDASKFDKKETFLRLMNEQRAGTVTALSKASDAELERESPEAIRNYAPTVGSTFALIGSHWMMHSGQWVVVRRKLGRQPMF
ncbi:MAG: DinB family protein [Planctomycetia bacterium]|nr:DinB family protein [Planctomycetia bacterium]